MATKIKQAKSDTNQDQDQIMYSSDITKYNGAGKAVFRAEGVTTYADIEPNINVRESGNFEDYESFRKSEAVPKRHADIDAAADKCYYRCGIVRRMIDLMGDFIAKGAELIHPIKKNELIAKSWWHHISGAERTERLANYLARKANVVVHRQTAKIKQKDIDNLHKGIAAHFLGLPPSDKFDKNEIPWKYTFLNTRYVEVVNEDDLTVFTQPLDYGMNLSQKQIEALKAQNILDPGVEKIGKKKKKVIDGGKALVPLNNRDIRVLHYKKDDWMPWAYPIVYACMDNVFMLEKLRLADAAALDSAISRVRLWNLGDLENKLVPHPAAFDKLAQMLMANPSGGQIDVIWGPDLKLTDKSSDIYHFLGQEKYIPHLNAIYECFGIPPTLVGTQVGGGMTNNVVSLRALIETLAYIRQLIVDFWVEELKILQRALGWKKAPQIVFEIMNISDPAAEKALLIQLVDRNILSAEAVQKAFGFIHEIETIRMRREEKAREDGRMLRKGGPWNNPEHIEALEKIALQQKLVTPSEVGVELHERKPGEKTGMEVQMEMNKEKMDQQNKGEPQEGRPSGAKDSSKRKQKEVKPRTTNALIWTKSAQSQIADYSNTAYLKSIGKNNLRQLTTDEAQELENIKFRVLCNMKMFSEFDNDIIATELNNVWKGDKSESQTNGLDEYKQTCAEFVEQFGREPNTQEVRDIQAMSYIKMGELNG